MKKTIKPFVLIILDGFGYRPDADDNAIAKAHKPNWDQLCAHYPHTCISGSGACVGLPEGQMGNSEVGHLNIGAGRVIYQEFTRIQHAIADGGFFNNPTLKNAMQKAVQTNKKIHILGLLSSGGVHSHEAQIHAALQLACREGAQSVYVHAFLDGRDTPPCCALTSIQALEQQFRQYNCGKIASMIGRYYAMDRDKRWDRVAAAYALLTEGKAEFHYPSAEAALHAAYARHETDEFVKATAIHAVGEKPVTLDDGDVVIFMNYRADRARELTRALTETSFSGFTRGKIPRLQEFVSLTQYAKDIQASVAYLPEYPKNTLGEYIAKLGLKQLRIAETEKYAHVTFFFNGGIETPFPGEERILVPSPKIATYDLQPEMSAPEVTDKLIHAIQSRQYSLIVCNFANPDMVGHTGNFNATVKAIEVIDACIGRIIAALQEVQGEALITADHGNAEQMYNTQLQQPHTAHTHQPVPLLYVGRPAAFVAAEGSLADIAPTLLYLMELPQPVEMTGRNLLKLI